jgi:hypothetical protein
MSAGRPWYREPETFIALAALVVSLTAVVVGIYEAWLQRAHDRAEVWPRLEVATWVDNTSARVTLDNTGLGPALVNQIVVLVDGRPQHDWGAALAALYGRTPPPHSTATVYQHALRPGAETIMTAVPDSAVPSNFFNGWISRVVVRLCYSSVFDESWILTDTLGKSTRWARVDKCPAQPANTDL